MKAIYGVEETNHMLHVAKIEEVIDEGSVVQR
jgi:hypothetical protein